MSSIPNAIFSTAQQYGVDPSLALEVAMQESGLNQSAVGSSGEIGVFQIMPATGADYGFSADDLADVSKNIQCGIMILAALLAEFGGDEQKAVAAYNCGPTCVNNAIAQDATNWLQYVPTSTQSYVSLIMAAVGTQYTAAVPGMPSATPGSVSNAGVGTGSSLSFGTIAMLMGIAIVGVMLFSD